ncbi:hypothetical protein ILUMI_24853 [Ignelater luminosus]|uniref:Reverse transcriptase domain-containing protein n=1 Tax=Ignelater luminosus TaxID=2038154 RepID=A0A8K0G0H8_IGNLU|nr:hypothetical protein ILUMI_24853 [Ignelater luminosus]
MYIFDVKPVLDNDGHYGYLLVVAAAIGAVELVIGGAAEDGPCNEAVSDLVVPVSVKYGIMSSGIDGLHSQHLKDLSSIGRKTEMCNYRDSIGEFLRPKQLGYGTKRGCEAAVDCCRIFIHQNTDTPKVLLKIDFRNAFNTVERNEMLKCVKDRIPKLYNILFQCYSKSSQLFFGEKRILSQVGAQQGDPAGPLLFCLVIQAVIENLNSELNIFYLDDRTLGGDKNTAAIEIINVIDRSIEVAFESISNISFDEQQVCIASLLIKFGGLGLRKGSDIMMPAFLASVNSVLGLITLMLQNITNETCIAFYPEALMEWQSVYSSSFPPVVSTQRNWDEINIAFQLNSLQFSNDSQMSRFKALQVKESNAWLTVPSTKSIGILLDNSVFRIGIALRYGCRICMQHHLPVVS